ncbi:copper amine oxidase N-terminal domain-containing protein [Paenibacillus rhizovicinus]|uniref:Copper amine oxidase N-terminal domain-containing protein n=1 Tax=Paenibacillus rhizovicinus TaxID=2704463 RepID=A0A6C0NXM1_9BACL|nr:stalk domain-containing protein [Paenibacillus rhizovicinus]QHW30995.1 copper amine oxidase N-terminal domain-containing protein [Paenibacillus rhizovicinus]
MLILSAAVLVGTTTTVIAERHIRLIVNGAEAKTGKGPVLDNGSVMIPIRSAAESLGKDVQWNGRTSEVSITDKEDRLTQYSKGNQKAVLWGTKVNGDYWGMRMTFGNMARKFPFWYNVGNPSYAPRIMLEDLNKDGKNELLVILTTGYGTGTKLEEAHIFDSETFSEIPLEDWQTYALKHVVPGKVTAEGAHIQIDHADRLIPHGIPAEDFESNGAQWWYDRPAYGQVIQYEVRQGTLYAVLPLWFSPANSAGQLEIRFAFQDGFYQGERIGYKA